MTTSQLWELAKQFSGSGAFKTLVAGAFGAFFGAWGAQIIISRNQKREAVVTELNSVAAALMLCFSICNAYVGMKKQIVRPLRERYDEAKRAYDEHQRAVAAYRGGPQPVLQLVTDFQTITPIKIPTEQLESFVFEKISLRGRGLAVAVTLAGAIDGLDKAVQYRNALIEEIRLAAPMDQQVVIQKYLGLRNALGAVDERFRSNVDAVCNQTDDCIFFSRTLAEDLFSYATRLRRLSFWKLRFGLPKVAQADWTKAEAAGLIPPKEQYADWFTGFPKRPTLWTRLLVTVKEWYSRAMKQVVAFPSSRTAGYIRNLLELFFSFSGEISRSTYRLAIGGSLALSLIGEVIAETTGFPIVGTVGGILLLVGCVSVLALSTKRVRDIGWPTRVVPLYVLPLIVLLWLTNPLFPLLGAMMGIVILMMREF